MAMCSFEQAAMRPTRKAVIATLQGIRSGQRTWREERWREAKRNAPSTPGRESALECHPPDGRGRRPRQADRDGRENGQDGRDDRERLVSAKLCEGRLGSVLVTQRARKGKTDVGCASQRRGKQLLQ